MRKFIDFSKSAAVLSSSCATIRPILIISIVTMSTFFKTFFPLLAIFIPFLKMKLKAIRYAVDDIRNED